MESFPKERTANNNLSLLKESERRLIGSVPFEKMCLDRASDLGSAAACSGSELTSGVLIKILRMKERRNSQEGEREEDVGPPPLVLSSRMSDANASR